MKRWVVLAVLGFIAVGFAQERLKVSLNYYLEITAVHPGFYDLPPDRRDEWLDQRKVNAPYDYYYNHDRIKWYHKFSRVQLELLKWGYALLFTLIHFVLSAIVILKFIGVKPVKAIAVLRMREDGKSLRYLIALYTGAAALSVLFFTLMRFVDHPDAAYAVARKLLGFMQSPFPLILVLFALRLQKAFD